MFKYKQCLLIRKDLKLSRGKLAVQCAHASVTAANKARRERKEWYKKWVFEGQKKVVLEVEDLEELLKYFERAKREGLPVSLITDAGLTEVPPNTKTAVGIGPAPEELVDKITGELKLL